MTYSVTVRERAGRLWITIPAAIRRSLGLRAGETGRWRKKRRENAYIITFVRSGREIRAHDPTAERAAAVNADLWSARGRLDAKKVADVFGIPHQEFTKIIAVDLRTMLKSPDSTRLQHKLVDFDRISRLRMLSKVTPVFFRRWLRTEIESLGGRSPIHWIREGHAEIVGNLVDNLVTSQPG